MSSKLPKMFQKVKIHAFGGKNMTFIKQKEPEVQATGSLLLSISRTVVLVIIVGAVRRTTT